MGLYNIIVQQYLQVILTVFVKFYNFFKKIYTFSLLQLLILLQF